MKKYMIALAFITTTCGASFAQKLSGTWKISRYETTTPDGQTVSLQNIGTIFFKGNGKGQKKLNYTVMGVTHNETTPFKWSASDGNIKLESKNPEFNKTWILTENKRKTQIWKATDGMNQVQILELQKQ